MAERHAEPEAARPGASPDARRVVIEDGGPILVEGPVEITMDDGTTVASDRFMVALCTCRRSRRFPFCDTSHRGKVRSSKKGSD